MLTATEYRYVVREDSILGGEPIVRDTRTPVRAIVELRRLGVIPEEIPGHLPHLGFAQVFGALRYYADHQPEIQGHIDRNQVGGDPMHPAVHPDA